MFKVPDLRNKILFSLLMLALYRLGSHVPVPGIDLLAVKELQEGAKNGGVLSLLQLVSLRPATHFAVLALRSMPYITSSITMQVLTGRLPDVERWRQQGGVRQAKLPQGARSLTIAAALGQAFALSCLLHNRGGGFGRVLMAPGVENFGGEADFTLARV